MKNFYLIFVAPSLCQLCIGMVHAAICPTGYTDHTNVDILPSMFMAPVNNRCTDGAYEYATIPDTFIPLYTGFTAGTAATLCGDGYLSGNTCVQYSQASCNNNYYQESSLAASTFMAPVNNRCTDGAYEYATIPDTFIPLYTGFTDGTAATLCGDGYLANGSTCTQYVQDDCPNDFVNIATDNTLFTTPNAGYCETNYSNYSINQQCDTNTTDAMCAMLCTDGLLYTEVGTCAAICSAGGVSLSMKKPDGSILRFPLYSTPQTTPTIAVGFDNGICYVNLVAGSGPDALNINKDGIVYHTVK